MTSVDIKLGHPLRQEVINQQLPLAFFSDSDEVTPLAWASENKGLLENGLAKYGAVLLRGFK